MRVNLPVNFSQFDSQWKDKLLGHNTDPKFNFSNFGCLQSCLADISRYFGKDDTPAMFNDKLIAVQGFKAGTGLYVHGAISKIYPDITERVVPTPDLLTDGQMAEIKQSLDAGQPVMVRLDYNPKTVERDDHFVVLVDYNPNDENDFTIADPLGGRFHSMKDYLGWLKPSIRKSIEGYFIYSGPNMPQQPVTPVMPEPTPEPEPVVEPEKPTPPPSGGVLPPNYGEIVHGSTQWDETVRYLELEKTPSNAFFEDVKRVIAGLKSAKTDYNNKRIEAEKLAEESKVQITNLKEDIGRLETQVATSEKMKKAEVDSLIANTPNLSNYKKEVEGVVGELQGSLNEAVNTIKQLRIELAHKKVDERIEAESESQSEFEPTPQGGGSFSIIALIRRFLTIK